MESNRTNLKEKAKRAGNASLQLGVKPKRKIANSSIASSGSNPVERLPHRKRIYVQERAKGASQKAAAAVAGVSQMQGSHYDKKPDVQEAYRYLMQQALPAKRLVSLIKGGCEAKMPVYSSAGKKIAERADWKTRRGYIEMATKQAGYYEDKSAGVQAAISFTINHIGQPDKGPDVNRRTIEGKPNAAAS